MNLKETNDRISGMRAGSGSDIFAQEDLSYAPWIHQHMDKVGLDSSLGLFAIRRMALASRIMAPQKIPQPNFWNL